jgi:hypothetical protein
MMDAMARRGQITWFVTTQLIFADRPPRMRILTGLCPEQADKLVADAYATSGFDPGRRRVGGPYWTVLMVHIYLRQNLTQALIAELFGCSQPTVSRWIGRLALLITTALTPAAQHRAERKLRSTMRVDGLAPIATDATTRSAGIYSGKRYRCGLRRHHAKAWQESGLAAAGELNRRHWT